jgi:hypothetical protein
LLSRNSEGSVCNGILQGGHSLLPAIQRWHKLSRQCLHYCGIHPEVVGQKVFW